MCVPQGVVHLRVGIPVYLRVWYTRVGMLRAGVPWWVCFRVEYSLPGVYTTGCIPQGVHIPQGVVYLGVYLSGCGIPRGVPLRVYTTVGMYLRVCTTVGMYLRVGILQGVLSHLRVWYTSGCVPVSLLG